MGVSVINDQDIRLVDAGNPLLAFLPQEQDFFAWGESLQYDPRRNWDRPFGKRPESHAFEIENMMIATERAINMSLNLHSLMIESLRRRDPRIAANRRRIATIAQLESKSLGNDLERMPWFAEGSSGAIVQGPTGVSKSHSIESFLRYFPQVVEHGPCEEYGWGGLKQLVYLVVPFPDEPSRRSLYKTILQAVDDALGTKYLEETKERATNGDLLLRVIKILTIHRCGLLILEEAQVRVLGTQSLGQEFVVTFLRLLNCGIPLVLIGNPMAFTNVMNFSQDLRRFSCAGVYNFEPVVDAYDPEWEKDLVPGIWGWTLFDEPDEIREGLNELLYERTGGVVDFLVRYRRESIIAAIRRGGTCVTAVDMEVAWRGPKMEPLHKLIDALVTNDMQAAAEFSDWPLSHMMRWSSEKKRRAAVRAQKMTAVESVPL